jgi:hypothetical protein
MVLIGRLSLKGRCLISIWAMSRTALAVYGATPKLVGALRRRERYRLLPSRSEGTVRL